MLSESVAKWPYRRVTLDAYVDHGEIYILDEARGGHDVIIPLKVAGSSRRIIADVGFQEGPPPNALISTWVDADYAEALHTRDPKLFPPISYTGVLLPSEPVATGTAPDLPRWVWPTAHVPSMAQALGFREAPLILFHVESPAEGWLHPQPFAVEDGSLNLAFAVAAMLVAAIAAAFALLTLLSFKSDREAYV